MKQFKVEFLGRMNLGNNPVMRLNVDGVDCGNAYRQGGLGIWATPLRPKLTKEETKELDRLCDAVLSMSEKKE